MTCRHLDGNRCSLELHGGYPSAGVCSVCSKYEGCPRGLGDVVHAVAAATGISAAVNFVSGGNCGCAERRAALNAAVPFPDERKEV